MNQPLAFIHPDAKIHPSVVIDPFVTIAGNVEIGEGTHIMSHACILDGARIGKNCTIHPGAVISGTPQDLKFRGEDTIAIVGDNTVIRECVTVHRGTASKGKTVVGSGCLIMAYCHVAHDCVVGNNVIMSNTVQLAGEVVVDDFAVIGGGALIHQFCHIGSHVMLQGGALVNKDIPPLRKGRTRAHRICWCKLHRTPSSRLLQRGHPRHPGNLPLPLPLGPEQLRCHRPYRSRAPRLKGA